MKKIKEGDKVQILCEAKLEDGRLCYKNEKEKPLELVVGKGSFFPAIETELKEMKEGETKRLTLESEQAFGPHIDELIIDVPKDSFRSDANLDVGSKVSVNTTTGKILHGTVTELKDEALTIDFNHPLAARKILFTVTVVSIL